MLPVDLPRVPSVTLLLDVWNLFPLFTHLNLSHHTYRLLHGCIAMQEVTLFTSDASQSSLWGKEIYQGYTVCLVNTRVFICSWLGYNWAVCCFRSINDRFMKMLANDLLEKFSGALTASRAQRTVHLLFIDNNQLMIIHSTHMILLLARWNKILHFNWGFIVFH